MTAPMPGFPYAQGLYVSAPHFQCCRQSVLLVSLFVQFDLRHLQLKLPSRSHALRPIGGILAVDRIGQYVEALLGDAVQHDGRGG